ncbi:hypothetical protein L7F22_015528, partial [Adiantum nelumboides]|nr:hypothetical protein [Adiantum nelumboides]
MCDRDIPRRSNVYFTQSVVQQLAEEVDDYGWGNRQYEPPDLFHFEDQDEQETPIVQGAENILHEVEVTKWLLQEQQ